jgi:hypothetical protein
MGSGGPNNPNNPADFDPCPMPHPPAAGVAATPFGIELP